MRLIIVRIQVTPDSMLLEDGDILGVGDELGQTFIKLC